MNELKCPHCNTPFVIDESGYASIVNQVKDQAFEQELQRRIAEIDARVKAEQKAIIAKGEQELQAQLSLRDKEMSAKEQEIVRLREQLDIAGEKKAMEMQSEIVKREQQISELRSKLESIEDATKVAIMTEQTKALNSIHEKEQEISELRNQLYTEQKQAHMRETALKEQHSTEMRVAEEMIERYRDMRSRLSTKMLGETLEEHCRVEYERSLRALIPEATFEKDNEVAEGSKGDFIFRAKDGDREYISIMFDMKNEEDCSANKKKNEDHLKKLDADRKKKGCEYAVLVSTLEAESELYNMGIVDVSHRYEKMYVVRPQFFVPIITLLTQAARKSLSYQRELAEIRSQSVDISNFEDNLTSFKEDIFRNVSLAHGHYEDAIKSIDESIKQLEKVKEALRLSGKNLRIANNKAQKVTIRTLTANNPTMQQMFDEIHRDDNGE